jgi:hypothetical protein
MGAGFILVMLVLTDAGERAGHGPRRRARQPRAAAARSGEKEWG